MSRGRLVQLPLAERVRVLSRTVGFEKVDPARLAALAELAEVRSYSSGELIFDEGDPAKRFRTVAGGRVKVAKSATSGRLFTAIVGAFGDTLNAVVLFDGSDHFLSARALDEALVLSVPRRDFLDFVAAHPEVAAGIITILGRIVRSGYERAMGMIEDRVEERIVKVLHMLHNKFGEELRFTAGELADLAGTTPESVLRVTGRLRDEGVIETGRGRIIILDPARINGPGQEPLLI